MVIHYGEKEMNDTLIVVLASILAIIVLVTVIVTPILLYGEYLKDERQAEVQLLDCSQLLQNIQDKGADRRDYTVREWIGDECWK